MKKVLCVLVLSTILALIAPVAQAQFRTALKDEPKLNTAQAMTDGDSFFSRLFDPSRYSMHQSYSMSVASSPAGSYGLTMFTNTFSFKPSDDFLLSADVSAVYSPFNSFGSDAFSKQMNGIYLTSARLDYKISDNSFLRVEYLGGPSAMYGGYGGYNGYGGTGYYGYNDPFNSPIYVPASSAAPATTPLTSVKKATGKTHNP